MYKVFGKISDYEERKICKRTIDLIRERTNEKVVFYDIENMKSLNGTVYFPTVIYEGRNGIEIIENREWDINNWYNKISKFVQERG